jgi:hypothetical protein
VRSVNLIKSPGGNLRPADESDAETISGIKNGSLVYAEFKQPRNPQFHRRFFAMLNFAYEYFQPEIPITKSGVVPERNFDKFREDVTILAGFYDVVVNIKGEARYQAKSISFGSMEDMEFQDLYKAVFGVCWRMVLSKVNGMTEQVAENVINSMMSFD